MESAGPMVIGIGAPGSEFLDNAGAGGVLAMGYQD